MVVTPCLLHPHEADKQVDAADHGVVALHRRHDLAIGQVAVLHFAFRIIHGWLAHLLKLFTVWDRSDCYQRWCSVEPSSLDSLIILDDEADDVELGGLAEQIVRVHVVEWRDYDPSRVHWLPLIAILNETLQVD